MNHEHEYTLEDGNVVCKSQHCDFTCDFDTFAEIHSQLEDIALAAREYLEHETEMECRELLDWKLHFLTQMKSDAVVRSA